MFLLKISLLFLNYNILLINLIKYDIIYASYNPVKVIIIIDNNIKLKYLLKYSLILTFFLFIIELIIIIDILSVKAVIKQNMSIFINRCGNIYIILSKMPLLLYVNIKEDKLNPIIKDL